MLSDEEIKKIKDGIQDLDNQIYELRILRKEYKDNNKLDKYIEVNEKINKLRDKKEVLNKKLIKDHKEKIGPMDERKRIRGINYE